MLLTHSIRVLYGNARLPSIPTLVKVHTHNYYIEGAHRHNELLWRSSVHGIAKVLALIFLQHYYTKIAAAYKQAVWGFISLPAV